MADTVSELIASARNLRDVRRYDLAIQQLSRALEMEPVNTEILGLLAECHRYNGDRAKSVDAMTAALRAAPDSPGVRLGAASLLGRMGRHRESIEHAEACLAIAPAWSWAHLHKADGLAGLGDFTGAVESIRLAIAGHPDNAHLRTRLGFFLHALHRNQEAQTEAELALKLDPDDSSTHHLLAGIAAASRNWTAYEAAISEALRLDPENSEAERWRNGVTALRKEERRRRNAKYWLVLLSPILVWFALRLHRHGAGAATAMFMGIALTDRRIRMSLSSRPPWRWSGVDPAELRNEIEWRAAAWIFIGVAAALEAFAHLGTADRAASIQAACGLGFAGGIGGLAVVRVRASARTPAVKWLIPIVMAGAAGCVALPAAGWLPYDHAPWPPVDSGGLRSLDWAWKCVATGMACRVPLWVALRKRSSNRSDAP
ncbi:MAG: hypothetical protein HMLKMBBP_01772 [Planctomycetes bacterium]|nr:hypothetical protein [Planctomycetota bacterium]